MHEQVGMNVWGNVFWNFSERFLHLPGIKAFSLTHRKRQTQPSFCSECQSEESYSIFPILWLSLSFNHFVADRESESEKKRRNNAQSQKKQRNANKMLNSQVSVKSVT